MKEQRFVKCFSSIDNSYTNFIVDTEDIKKNSFGYNIHGLNFSEITVLSSMEAYHYCEDRVRKAAYCNDYKYADWLIAKYYECYDDAEMAQSLDDLYQYQTNVEEDVANYLAARGLV